MYGTPPSASILLRIRLMAVSYTHLSNIEKKLAKRSLHHERQRNLFAIIALVLTAFMITATLDVYKRQASSCSKPFIQITVRYNKGMLSALRFSLFIGFYRSTDTRTVCGWSFFLLSAKDVRTWKNLWTSWSRNMKKPLSCWNRKNGKCSVWKTGRRCV